ncbi:MAG: hypothetical protein QOF28_2922, partial [Actinomycetota bacterium]|nr:hypothetical protein [Actinomycetota bacterium]
MLGRRIVAIGGVMLALGGVAASSAQAGTGPTTVVSRSVSASATPAAAPAERRSATAAAAPTAATVGSTVGFNGIFAMGLYPVTQARELDGVAASGSHRL